MLALLDSLHGHVPGLKPPMGEHWGWWLLWLPWAAFWLALFALAIWLILDALI